MASEVCMEGWRNICGGYCSYTLSLQPWQGIIQEKIFTLWHFLSYFFFCKSFFVSYSKRLSAQRQSSFPIACFQTLIILTRTHQFYHNFKPVTTVIAMASRHSQKFPFVFISLTHLTGHIDWSLITQISWTVTLWVKKNNMIWCKSVFQL